MHSQQSQGSGFMDLPLGPHALSLALFCISVPAPPQQGTSHYSCLLLDPDLELPQTEIPKMPRKSFASILSGFVNSFQDSNMITDLEGHTFTLIACFLLCFAC